MHRYGQVCVTHVATTQHKNFVVRKFEIERDGEQRIIKQFAYTAWPDHSVPRTTQELLEFRHAVRASVTKPASPLVVHCSAGVGPTGTYIAIDRLLSQAIDTGNELSVDDVIRDMRKSRNFMVQTEVQYVFVHEAVHDALAELVSGASDQVCPWPDLCDRPAWIAKPDCVQGSVERVRVWGTLESQGTPCTTMTILGPVCWHSCPMHTGVCHDHGACC